MAKVPFSKLQANINNETVSLSHRNKNGEEVFYEVKKYLPIEDKLELVTKILNQSIDDNGFYNPMRVELFMVIETVFAYSNLSFTEKMKEDLFKLYDIFISTNIFSNIIAEIPGEWKEIEKSTWSVVDNIYNYKNSIMGVLEAVTSDYSNLKLDASEITKELQDPNTIPLLKDIMTKLG